MIDDRDVAAPICGETVVGEVVDRELEASIAGVQETLTIERHDGCRYRVPEPVVVPA